MRITHGDDDNGKKTLSVEADWAELATDYDDIVSEYANVPIPGFRLGKVPRSVIEQRLQKQILDDLSHRAAQRLGREAVRETGAESLGPTEIGDIEGGKGKPFQFTARFWPMPEIALPDLGLLVVQEDGSDPRDMISHRLLEMVSFTVPDELVRAELELDGSSIFTHENAEWKAAEDRVRLMLILKRIAGKEGIEVTEADVERRINDKAAEFGTDPDTLRMELEKGGGRRRLKDMLLAESTLEYITEKSQGTKGE
jgi:FKBP-type peptidyl-prolyl cis-trans isomerase (trigger factor)